MAVRYQRQSVSARGTGARCRGQPLYSRLRKLNGSEGLALRRNHHRSRSRLHWVLPLTSAANGGPATSATLGLPYAVAVDETGNVFISDIGSGSIREVTKSNGLINTVVSGVASDGMVTDPAGNLYYADFHYNTVNELATSGAVTTLAGNGFRGLLW